MDSSDTAWMLDLPLIKLLQNLGPPGVSGLIACTKELLGGKVGAINLLDFDHTADRNQNTRLEC